MSEGRKKLYSQSLIESVEHARVQRNLSQRKLAEACHLSETRISELLNNKPVSLNVVHAVCDFLEIDIAGDTAPNAMLRGYSSKADVAGYIGKYLWVRPIFDHHSAIGIYPMSVTWSKSRSILEISRTIHDKRLNVGDIYINNRGYVNVFAAQSGFATLATFCPMTENNNFYGLMLCLGEIGGAQVSPVCVPAALLSIPNLVSQTERLIMPESGDEYEKYKQVLEKIRSEKFGIFQFF